MSPKIGLEKSQVVDLYRQMLLIRRFEEQCSRLYMQGKIKGFLHLYIGEEAIAVGSISALNDNDYVVTHYRDHGHALAKGMEPSVIMAELMGKATGSSGGKGGSMHLFDAAKGFMGGYAIVGGQLPIAVGLALAIKYKNEGRAVLCFFGDGATNAGEFHESLNLASLWKLPILFFLENNLYGMGTQVERTRAGGKDIYLAADAYKIEAAQIDGMDVLDVRTHTAKALDRIRSGKGPVLLEAMTYRYRGHSVADPTSYRDKSEVEEWELKDPIGTFKKAFLKEGLLNDEDAKYIEGQVVDTVADAIRFAEESDDPSPGALYENVYS